MASCSFACFLNLSTFMWKIYGNLFYWFCLCYSPVSGAPIDDEYNLQDHSDLYILDLGKQGFNLNKL